jgi:NADPH-dependent glutamate synthase beta subunit-like oxidoreductase/coenzyme F420-reducing hydrogenase delta subunit
VQAYLALIARGQFKEALRIIRQSIPFPIVCGRVCFAPCEEACTRRDIDDYLNIRALKRLVSDYEPSSFTKSNISLNAHTEKIAIIGSGPAGLTAAHDLVMLGYPVTVFETSPKPGGCLRFAIPVYRLPEEVLDKEINYIKEIGVDIRTNTNIGKDLTIKELKSEGYKAFFFAIGAHKCIKLNLEGEELKGVYHSLEYLKNMQSRNRINLGERIVIIGGGNVAVDAARTALRLGSSDITVLYRRSEKEMPAHHNEVEAARREGVKFQYLVAPKKILGKDGEVTGVECIQTVLGPPDESGRRRPIQVEGSEFIVPADTVLLAIGMMPDITHLPEGIDVGRGNRVIANEITLETNLQGFFAGGDAVSGPSSVIEAIASGKRAAESIHRFLRGQNLKAGRTKQTPELTWVADITLFNEKPRVVIPCLKPNERTNNFKEVELGFTTEEGIKEAHRCLFCGPCSECLEKEGLCEEDDSSVEEDRCIACANCEKICQYGAITVKKSVAKVDPHLCKGCGTCVVECPAEAIKLANFNNQSILNRIETAVSTQSTKFPSLLAFVCVWSYNSDRITSSDWPQNTTVIPVKCGGRVDPHQILQAFARGIDGVLVINCDSNDCHYVFGGSAAIKHLKNIPGWLKSLGINTERFKVLYSLPGREQDLKVTIRDFALTLQQIGLSPLRSMSTNNSFENN